MKNYKDYEKTIIGSSDIAELTLIGENGEEKKLNFGEDGTYKAYIVNEDTEIPSHYKKVAEFKNVMRIRDDKKITVEITAEAINVFQAGQFGCIIQMINK